MTRIESGVTGVIGKVDVNSLEIDKTNEKLDTHIKEYDDCVEYMDTRINYLKEDINYLQKENKLNKLEIMILKDDLKKTSKWLLFEIATNIILLIVIILLI